MLNRKAQCLNKTHSILYFWQILQHLVKVIFLVITDTANGHVNLVLKIFYIQPNCTKGQNGALQSNPLETCSGSKSMKSTNDHIVIILSTKMLDIAVKYLNFEILLHINGQIKNKINCFSVIMRYHKTDLILFPF